MSKTNVRISGFGGQGIILAGVILARAAVEHDGIFATQTQSYGAESRGGDSVADVILSEVKIDYPEPERLDLLVALSQVALNRNLNLLVTGGTLIVDPDMVTDLPVDASVRVLRIAATRTAEVAFGKRAVANMIILGALAKLTGLVTVEGLILAMQNTLDPRLVDMNRLAIESGVSLAERVLDEAV